MPDLIWPLGTDSSETLRGTLRDYLKARLDAKKPSLPRRFLHVLLEGERQTAGIFVIVATQPDDKESWPYKSGARRVLEERHGIAIIVKADAKAGGSASVLKVFSVIRALFSTDAERETLQALGVQNITEATEGLEGDAGDAVESTAFRRQLNLKCTTETYLT